MRYLLILLFTVISCIISAQADTTVVQTFTFEAQNNPNTAYDSPGRRWFEFPASDNGLSYQKILMYYTLKCFEDGTAGNLGYPCGEWDYLTYTYLFQHTGVMDSVLAQHPLYFVNNIDFDEAHLRNEPLYLTQESEQTTYSIVSSENASEGTIGDEPSSSVLPFAEHPVSSSVYLYTAAELINAGLEAGEEIGRISFHLEGSPALIPNCRIGLALTDDSSPQGLYNDLDFFEAYQANLTIAEAGWLDLVIADNFIYDGVSNLLVKVSYTDNQEVITPVNTIANDMGEIRMASSSGEDRFIRFDWQDEVEVPASVFESVDQEVSIMFWLNGDPAAQPQDGTVFEGVNAQNQRVLNTHLPWSNGRIYWDAGQDGGYDRIDKLAAASDYEGNWNHWCFTKNAQTGEMKIYRNGVLWHSGTNLDNSMAGITRFSIGGATSWNNFYRGSMDEFAVFNQALDETAIQESMLRDMDDSHPFWSSLQVYYKFNEGNGERVEDASGHERHAWIHGNAARIFYNGSELWRNVSYSPVRPMMKVTGGVFTTEASTVIVQDLIEIPPVSVVRFAVEDYTVYADSIYYAWEEQFTYTITPEGEYIDSIWMPAAYTLINEEFSYWQRPFEIVNRFELSRFITMYGINLDLGPDGWTWVVDVTDWAPLLRDSVELEAGNWQELLDLKFLFIEGVPAREVRRIERVWDRDVSLASFNEQIAMQNIEKLPGEESWKLITTNTGHQFDNPPNCAEFCSNIQEVEVNGQTFWSWDIMQECATNPLFPQGGTWIFDRAGWCPGMNSTTKEFELTPHTGDGDSFTIDYKISDEQYGNYVFFGTLVAYGEIVHAHDPELEMITAPSNWKIHSRWNPICNEARFMLRNKGSEPLTDLNIIYGVIGGETASFHWQGNLGFMESEEVSLVYSDPILWTGDPDLPSEFFVQLGFSADGSDENVTNNYATSTFYRPPVYQYPDLDDNRLIIRLKTNEAFGETSYALYDINGNTVFSRNDFTLPLEEYLDTIQLNAGCYFFHLQDSDDDGLRFFANNDGTGHCKLDRVQGLDFISFQRDFGKELRHYFYWNTNIVSVGEQTKDAGIRIYPNPVSNICHVEAPGFDNTLFWTIFDAQGSRCIQDQIQRKSVSERVDINTSSLAPGFYTLVISDGVNKKALKLIRE